MASRVVVPDDVTLHISNGDWLVVKKRLNAGENKAMVRAGTIDTGDGLRVDLMAAGLARIVAYLIDWSLTGLDGKVIPIRGKSATQVTEALHSIDPDSYTEILRAIEAHEQAMQAERDAEKNAQGGEPASPAISPSPFAVAGVTSGSPS